MQTKQPWPGAHQLLSVPGMALWWCEGRLCSVGTILLPPAPTSSGHWSQRRAGEGDPPAGRWSPAPSSRVVSCCCCHCPPCTSIQAETCPIWTSGFTEPSVSQTIQSPSVLRLLETTSAAVGPVWSRASAELPDFSSLTCFSPGRWDMPSPSHHTRCPPSLSCSVASAD